MRLKLKELKSFETGHPDIDADHERIVAVINKVAEAVEAKDHVRCTELMAEFITEAQAHFRREEDILRDIGFPRFEQHQIYHRGLILRAKAVKAICDGKADLDDMAVCFEELSAFLIDDIIKGDMDFKSFLEQRRAE